MQQYPDPWLNPQGLPNPQQPLWDPNPLPAPNPNAVLYSTTGQPLTAQRVNPLGDVAGAVFGGAAFDAAGQQIGNIRRNPRFAQLAKDLGRGSRFSPWVTGIGAGANALGAGLSSFEEGEGALQSGLSAGAAGVGALAGGALGSFLGPLGAAAGAYLGGKAGDFLVDAAMGEPEYTRAERRALIPTWYEDKPVEFQEAYIDQQKMLARAGLIPNYTL